MKRALGVVGILALVQLALVGLYLLLEEETAPRIEHIRRTRPELAYETRDGRTHELSALRRPVVLHFWATWCPPCRDELPALLDYARSSDLEVLAVALDPEWAPIDAFLGGTPPDGVVRALSAPTDGFDVETLPVTFVVTADGWLIARFDGDQDWSSRAVRGAVTNVLSR